MAFETARPDDHIGDAGLVLQRGEDDARGRAGTLAHQHQPGQGDPAAIAHIRQGRARHMPALGQLATKEAERMGLQRQAQRGVVLGDLLTAGQLGQGDGMFRAPAVGAVEQGQRLAGFSEGGPAGLAPVHRRSSEPLSRRARRARSARL